ncbi:hypothetical protein ADK47_13690 [Streptomyces rimosus subsp. rimosus]|nr:hypothetical protein DF17_12775 [Streptomyces rimosus]KOG76937.1 hypothetical protein ADK78_09535 [Kitasatospora aureofaciens]KOT41480.1 hypothetical protein ADK84_11720 [Streptomyces sp. NRRL WC-3701]KOT43771.1 hypothetical protein ADK42_07175 [Streptomyces rimosus subsp. rimosus]KEF11657.1 hypothetical protein DF18_35995 [Streptomyces rimosus]
MSILILFTWPSTTPEFQGSVRPAVTASRSRSRCWAKPRRLGRPAADVAASIQGQLVALEVGHHVAEGAHMLGERRQFGAVGQDDLEVGPVAFGKGVGVGEEPARDGAGRWGGRGLTGWCLPRRFC